MSDRLLTILSMVNREKNMSIIQSSLKTKKIIFKNRLIFPPIATNSADENGLVTEKLLKYYAEKTQGGYLSMVVTEHCFISQRGRAVDHQLSLATDETIRSMSKLAEIIHKNGTKVTAQINHAGALGMLGVKNAGPSAMSDAGRIRPGKNFIAGYELRVGEIQTIIEQFAASALRAKKAGCDAVEIHSAHGYLLNEFYSTLSNHRTDAYGNGLQGRIRFHKEVIRAVRTAVGEDFPILLRFGALDYVEGGSGGAEALEAAKAFEEAGVDILDISGGLTGYSIKGHEGEQGYFREITKAIKEVVSVPVILTGGITDVMAAEQLLEEGAADLIGVGRIILRDSQWAERAMTL